MTQLTQDAIAALQNSGRKLPYEPSESEVRQIFRVATLLFTEQEPEDSAGVVLAIATGIAAGLGGGLTEERMNPAMIAAADALTDAA